jgi:UDP-N-acetylmuramyl pentapeptide phosphotransferase/UDP-N-acetylglucosamine-1-phosphate transferase
MNYLFFLFIPIFIFLLNSFFKRKNLLSNFSGDKHQKFLGNKDIPLSGGIFLLIFSIPIIKINSILYIFLLSIFLIGLFSDLKVFLSPLKRFFFQSIIIITFVFLTNLQINTTGVIFLDFFLQNTYFSIFFSYFCLIILINGTNFIDGLNGLVLVYYSIVSIIILKLCLELGLIYNQFYFEYLLYILFILIIFNFLNQLYLGDSGSYILSLLVGFLLIKFYNDNKEVSSFFIILLLWYPCFENLFSIIRKFQIHRSPLTPDNKHIHQLIYHYLKVKLKRNDLFTNNFASLIINFYNFLIILLGSEYFFNTQILILLIILNIVIYAVIYLRLFKFKFRI